MAEFTPSSRKNPCEICNRTKDGDCRKLSDGFWLCHTYSGLENGEQAPDGAAFRFLHDTEDGNWGIWKPAALWTDSKPARSTAESMPARLPKEWQATGTSTKPTSKRTAMAMPVTLTTKLVRPRDSNPFHYRKWDGTPVKATKNRTDHGDGRDREIGWAPTLKAEKLTTADLAPYRWHEFLEHHQQHGGPVLISKGELKVSWAAAIGLQAISIHGWNKHLEAELLKLGSDAVLVPDCDLADLQGWYAKACKALPQARSLLTPGANWAEPPEKGGVGLDDWLQTHLDSVTPSTASELLAAITDQPWGGDGEPVDRQGLFKNLRAYTLELLQKKTPVHERTALIRAAANDCGFNLRDGEIFSLVAEARRKLQGKASAVEPGDEFDIPEDAWAWGQIIAACTANLIVALQKVGKTALVAGMISAWHHGALEYLGLPLIGPCPPVIFAGTDQTIADCFRVLAPAGLMDRNPETGKARLTPGGPIKKLWHRSQPVFLDMAGIEEIEEACKQNPGALLVCDTYAALVAPLGLDEAKPEVAEPLYNLLEVIEQYGITLILIHHASKSRADERASNASRNSNAIPAAVSQIISLQWVEPDKKTDQRILLTTEGRNSKPADLVIEQVDRSQWVRRGSSEEVRQQQQREKTISNLTERLTLVFMEVQDRWESRQLETTAQDILQALPDEIDDERKARAALQSLLDKRLVEKRTLPPAPASTDEDDRPAGRPSLRYRPTVARARGGLPTEPPKPPKPPEVLPQVVSEPTIHTTSFISETFFASSITEVSEVSEAVSTDPRAREVQTPPYLFGTTRPADPRWQPIHMAELEGGQRVMDPKGNRYQLDFRTAGGEWKSGTTTIPIGPGWFVWNPTPPPTPVSTPQPELPPVGAAVEVSTAKGWKSGYRLEVASPDAAMVMLAPSDPAIGKRRVSRALTDLGTTWRAAA